MIRRPPSPTRTDTLVPDTTLFRSLATAAAGLLHRPFKRCLDRGGRGVDVGAVETKPRLKPQAVARAEADGEHLRIGEQPLGKTHRVCRGHADLEAVLAGIAGAGDQDRKSVGEGKSVSVRLECGGRRLLKQKK